MVVCGAVSARPTAAGAAEKRRSHRGLAPGAALCRRGRRQLALLKSGGASQGARMERRAESARPTAAGADAPRASGWRRGAEGEQRWSQRGRVLWRLGRRPATFTLLGPYRGMALRRRPLRGASMSLLGLSPSWGAARRTSPDAIRVGAGLEAAACVLSHLKRVRERLDLEGSSVQAQLDRTLWAFFVTAWQGVRRSAELLGAEGSAWERGRSLHRGRIRIVKEGEQACFVVKLPPSKTTRKNPRASRWSSPSGWMRR